MSLALAVAYPWQALESGKPEKVVEKMVTGRLERFYAETVLLEQSFVRDGSLTVTVSAGLVLVSVAVT